MTSFFVYFQVYQGLDIITNKVTAAEQQVCRHHLIGYLSPLCEKHTVIDYRAKALPVVSFGQWRLSGPLSYI